MTRFSVFWLVLAGICALDATAAELIVRDTRGMPLSGAMVSRSFVPGEPADTSDNGYPAPGMRNIARPETTRFTDQAGSVRFEDSAELVNLRVRKPGYRDQRISAIRGDEQPELILEAETDPQKLADSKPANLWLSLLDFDGNEADREHFLLHCGFCHQQASPFMRNERTQEQWLSVIERMNSYGARLPTEAEWEKAARGTDTRPFPWGDDIQRENANFYSSRDPFENMASFGSRTSPVGFYNGKTYDGYQTLDSVSPYGLYDMAGNVWQWTGDVYEGMHYRFMRGGSKDTYSMDLRIWVRNNATPIYFSPGVGFRCARDSQ